MVKNQTAGKCYLCQASFAKAGMGRHIVKCCAGHDKNGKGKKAQKLILQVQGRHSPEYWMFLAVPARATLADLDNFLRSTWLECCGHLSAFEIAGKHYQSSPDRGERDLRPRLQDVLKPGVQFTYEYDFGSTTALVLKVLADTEAEVPGKGPVQLLSRNEPPEVACGRCGQPATRVAAEQAWDPASWLCDKCAQREEFDEEMFLPVVNSPRVGVCGYTGD